MCRNNKKVIKQAAMETAKTVTREFNEESIKHVIGASHLNAKEVMRPRTGGSSPKQTVFDRYAKDKCTVLKDFEMDVINILTRPYELTDAEKVPIIKNWLGW